MAFRLGELVMRGELNNTHKNSVHGWLELQGVDKPVILSLTGDCGPDLAGRHIRFAPGRPPESIDAGLSDETEAAGLERLGLRGLAWQQIGPTGEMTAARKVQVPDCSMREYLRRIELGEPPPTEWKRCLYLEWYSQNGRMLIEMADPQIESVEDEAEDEPAVAEHDAGVETDPDEDEDSGAGLDVTEIGLSEDGEAEVLPEESWAVDEHDAPDEYGLISDDLQRELDAQARLTDWALRDSTKSDVPGEEEGDSQAELELMDDLIEHGEGQLLGDIFNGVVSLPPADSLDEEQAEQRLKAALGRLAMFGVALHMCEHFTPKQAYRLLVEEYCREEFFFPEMKGTQWVQHFDTAESCDTCQAEFEREVDEEESKKNPPSDEPKRED